jgi:mannobiose 2-epimerase
MKSRIPGTLLLVMGVILAGLVRPEASAESPPLTTGKFIERVEAELRGNILPFWLKHARDRERGGFFGEIDGRLRVKKDAPRGALLSARVLWTFSAAFRRYQDPEYREMAQWALEDLNARFWDEKHSGLVWRMHADGGGLDTRKVVYVQAFGIYGLSEYYRATGEQAALDRAIELYRLLERYSHDREHRGYLEEFTRDWKVSHTRGPRRSAMGSLDQKSQNVHLHLLEAYTNLLRVWPDPELKRNLRELIEVMQTKVLDASTHHLRLFLAEDWSPRSDTISFGHDVEYSWLVTEAAEVLGDEQVIEGVKRAAVKIAAVTLAQGVDLDGGVLAEADANGLTDTFKEWWPQAEATVGFLNAYQLSGEPRYLHASMRSWGFIERHLVDREKGEWLHGVSRDGRRKSTLKIGFWKCPYHNGRACMELVDRLRNMQPVAP